MKKINLQVKGNGISTVCFSVKDTLPEFILKWFTDWITSYVDRGAEFVTGQTIQYGWSILQVELENETLKIVGPDFLGMPINWIEDISMPLYLVMEQKYVAESYDADIDICGILDTSVTGEKLNAEPIIMRRRSRSEQNGQDSGWYIAGLREDVGANAPESRALMSLYEVSLHIPAAVKFLWLPEGYEVILKKDEFEVVHNGITIQPKKDSYVAEKYNKQMQRKKFSLTSVFSWFRH